jgi:aryl-alcohol dehydrogenase-like predicted oxidoreductase
MAWEEPRKTGMQYRRLGNSGLHVSVLGLGGWLTYVLDQDAIQIG